MSMNDVFLLIGVSAGGVVLFTCNLISAVISYSVAKRAGISVVVAWFAGFWFGPLGLATIAEQAHDRARAGAWNLEQDAATVRDRRI